MKLRYFGAGVNAGVALLIYLELIPTIVAVGFVGFATGIIVGDYARKRGD